MDERHLNITPADIWAKMRATGKEKEAAAFEVVCEQALTDPQGRGVRVDLWGEGSLAVQLTSDVPYGQVLWMQHSALWMTPIITPAPEGDTDD